MKIHVKKITDELLLKEACEFTILKEISSTQTIESQLKYMHSPIRTQTYIIRMYDIPSFAAQHIRTHHEGVLGHFITSRRDDRGGEKEETRSEPVNHMFIANLEALINIANARLCVSDVHDETRKVVKELVNILRKKEIYLYDYLVPMCDNFKRCLSMKPCGRWSDE